MTSVPTGTHDPVLIASCIDLTDLQLNGQMAVVLGIKTGNSTGLTARRLWMPMAPVSGVNTGSCTGRVALQLNGQMVDVSGGSMAYGILKNLGVLQHSQQLNWPMQNSLLWGKRIKVVK